MDLFGTETQATTEQEVSGISETKESAFLAEPRSSSLCLGHEDNEARILDLLRCDRLPHGLVFSGPEGIGKATFAFRLARFLLALPAKDTDQQGLFGSSEMEKPEFDSLNIDPESGVFHRVSSGGHADLFTVERRFDPAKGKKPAGLEIAEVRKVEPFLRRTATEGGWRIVIIDDADLMNRNAQNALLKILEEPPAKSAIILICHRIGALLPTIRSRCRVMHFQPLKDEFIQRLLSIHDPGLSDEETANLCTLAKGSIGKALSMIEERGLKTLEQVTSILGTYPELRWTEIHQLADTLARQGQDQVFLGFQEVMLRLARDLCTAHARQQDFPPGQPAKENLHKILGQINLEQAVKIYEQMRAHFEEVNRANLEKREAVMRAFTFLAA